MTSDKLSGSYYALFYELSVCVRDAGKNSIGCVHRKSCINQMNNKLPLSKLCNATFTFSSGYKSTVFIQREGPEETHDQPAPPFLWKVMWTLICHVTFSVRIYTSLPSGNHLRETSVGGQTSPLVIPPTGRREKVPSCFHRRLINWRCWDKGTYNTG